MAVAARVALGHWRVTPSKRNGPGQWGNRPLDQSKGSE